MAKTPEQKLSEFETLTGVYSAEAIAHVERSLRADYIDAGVATDAGIERRIKGAARRAHGISAKARLAVFEEARNSGEAPAIEAQQETIRSHYRAAGIRLTGALDQRITAAAHRLHDINAEQELVRFETTNLLMDERDIRRTGENIRAHYQAAGRLDDSALDRRIDAAAKRAHLCSAGILLSHFERTEAMLDNTAIFLMEEKIREHYLSSGAGILPAIEQRLAASVKRAHLVGAEKGLEQLARSLAGNSEKTIRTAENKIRAHYLAAGVRSAKVERRIQDTVQQAYGVMAERRLAELEREKKPMNGEALARTGRDIRAYFAAAGLILGAKLEQRIARAEKRLRALTPVTTKQDGEAPARPARRSLVAAMPGPRIK